MKTNNQSHLSNYLAYCTAQKQLDSKTIKAYIIDLNQFLCFIKDTEIEELSIPILESYISSLHAHYKPKTVKRKIASTKAFFHYLEYKEILEKNPFDNVVLPKTEYKKRDIWDAETIRLALDQCTDSKLYIAMNLAFACSLRMGEILGLTWKNVHIEDENIATDNAYIYIEAELARASKQAIETLGEKDIYHIFTPLMPNTSTRIILKKPKTDSSIRKVWLPKTVAY